MRLRLTKVIFGRREKCVLCAVAVSAALAGCSTQVQSHFLPSEYVGAVVVVFGHPEGVEIDLKSNPVEFHIPDEGILLLSNPGPPESYAADFFYVDRKGSMERIAYRERPDLLQVFGLSVGKYHQSEVGWISYLVGVPNSRYDWISMRESKIAEAVIAPEPIQVE